MDAVFPRPQILLELAFELALGQPHGVRDDRAVGLTPHRGENASLRERIAAFLLEDAELVGPDLRDFAHLSAARELVEEVPPLGVDLARDAFLPLLGEDLPQWEILASHIPEDVELVLPRTEPADGEQEVQQDYGHGDAADDRTPWYAEI